MAAKTSKINLSDIPPQGAPLPPGLSPRDVLASALAVKFALLRPEELASTLAAWAKDNTRPLRDVLAERLGDPWVKISGEAERVLTSGGSVTFAVDDACPMPRPAGHCRFNRLTLDGTVGLRANWLAYDDELGRVVAYREIQEHEPLNTRALERFKFETQVTASLEHPGIPAVYGMGQHPDGRPYAATRCVQGETLETAIRRHHEANLTDADRRLEMRDMLTRFVTVCNAVAYAHSRNVIHRDLRPSIIVLGQHDETVITEWANARRDEQRDEDAPLGGSDRSGHVGTLPYAAPEQVEGRHDQVGPRSDVYSLGAIIYHVATGQAPFGSDAPDVVRRRILAGECQPVRQVNPRTHPALETICKKAMALDPAKRYDSPRALAEDLKRWLANPDKGIVSPDAVKPPTFTAAGLVLAGLALVLGAGLSLPAGMSLGSMNAKVPESLTEELADTQTKLKTANKALEEKAGELELVRKDIKEQVRVQSAEEIGKARAQLEAKTKELKGIRDNIDKTVEDATKEVVAMAEMKAEAKLKNRLNAAAMDLKKAEAAQRAAETARKNAETELTKAKEELATANKTLTAAQKEADRYKGDFTTADKEKKDALARLKAAQDAQEKAEAAKTEAVKNLTATQEGKKDAEKKLAIAEEAKKTAEKEAADALLAKKKAEDGKKTAYTALAKLQGDYDKLAKDKGGNPVSEKELAAARKSIDDAFTLAKDDPFLQRQSLAATREKLLEKTLAFYQTLKPQKEDDRAAVLARIAFVASEVAIRNKKDLKEALDRYEEARKAYLALTRAEPKVLAHKAKLAAVTDEMGVVQRVNKQLDESRKTNEAARKLYEELINDEPKVPEHQAGLASVWGHLAGLSVLEKKEEEAFKEREKARDIYLKLVEDHPKVPEYRAGLGQTYNTLGFLLNNAGKSDDALKNYTRAVDLFVDLVKEQPDVQPHKVQLAVISGNLANRLRAAKKLKEALDVVNRALPSLITLRNQEPENSSFRVFLLNMYRLRAFTLAGLQRSGEAAADFKEAIALETDEAAQRTMRCQRVLMLALNNEAKSAVAEGQVVARDRSLDGDQLVTLARAFSVAIKAIPKDLLIPEAQRKTNADDWSREGAELLSRARDAGAFKDRRNRDAVRNSTAFDSLRATAEVKKLINGFPADE